MCTSVSSYNIFLAAAEDGNSAKIKILIKSTGGILRIFGLLL